MSNGEKKNLSPAAWIAIGCGALAVLAIVGVVAVVGLGLFKAKQFVDDVKEDGQFSISTPEGDVSVDLSGGEKGGSISIKGPDGEEVQLGADASLDNVPEWVPLYPDAEKAQGSFHSKTGKTVQGALSVRTSDSPEEVLDYYSEWFEAEGYEIRGPSTTQAPQGSFSTVSGELASPKRTLNVAVIVHDGATQLTLNYGGESG